MACRLIAQRIENGDLSAGEASIAIREVASEFHLGTVPRNEHILQYLHDSRARRLLMVKPAKTASGVAVIAVMPKPYECPHGRCVYCPGGIEFNTPLSYTGTEPATRSAQKFAFDPYQQVKSKLEHLQSRGHDTGKTEIVIVGGTFPFMPVDYQRGFAKSCYDALNGSLSENLEDAKASNENASNRCVGFTVETKPDYCKEPHVDLMLELGVTRVEIGVQSLRNEVYKLVNRGHNLDDVIDAFRIARDSGCKIAAHMMPGLPGSSPEKDIEDFRRLFEDEALKPDMLKIYPTLVVEHTGLHKMQRNGRYHAYSDADLVEVIVEAKKIVPAWVRIMRVQREIESKDIVAGPKSGNLRQVVLRRLRDIGFGCRCIRCREAGLQRRYPGEDDVELKRVDYGASGGREIFLSYESRDGQTILGFLRLRKVARPHRIELAGSAIVRELHVYGQAVGVGKEEARDSFQHRGYGAKLLKEAERISESELGVDKIAVIAAVGTRQYYRRRGYRQDGPYVSKVF
ncbi:MAG TPA: tRNA uridine(34) 5-carboxymethylaminomethyl modification radical SAM/GNAT enzyme Elp3 [Nitrososphaera sp.]|nr:tRNA uridine(34) 5-carboxymethylaminomethyl modification radical SAM/GNAT enzyme Elp3 [Nitrososphaera sp.]